MLQYERQAWERGCSRVAGVDEAGRGPLAGPVAAAAVVFDKDFASGALEVFKGLTDSKKLSCARREGFFEGLKASPRVQIGVGLAEVEEIDRLNILRATREAMVRAIRQLDPPPDHVLLDGLPMRGMPYPSTAIVKGDALSFSIAAASVVAKVTRDRIMLELDRRYPGYGLARHKGYGTRLHLEALARLGPSPVHRKSFRPVWEQASGRGVQLELYGHVPRACAGASDDRRLPGCAGETT